MDAPSGTERHDPSSRIDALIDALALRGHKPLLHAFTATESAHWSYRQVGRQVQALARGLRQRTTPGEAVVLMGAPRPAWLVAALATLRAGAVVTPLDVQLADDTLRRIFDDCGARWAFTDPAHAQRLREAAPDVRLVLLDESVPDGQRWKGLTTDDDGAMPDNGVDDPATLFYTSGTTGPPKGVPLTHGNLGFQLDSLATAGITRQDDHVLLPLPLHHVYPFVIGMLAPLWLGLTLVTPHALTGPQLVRTVRESKASVIIGVPRLYAALFDGIAARAARSGRLGGAVFRYLLAVSRAARRRLGLRLGKQLLFPLHREIGPDLRVLASGGSALDPDLAWNLEALGWQVAVGYGLTETAPLLTIDPPGRARPGTVGRPIPGVELRIDTRAPGEEQGRGQGEIQVRGPSVFAGYRNQPDKTREAFTADGWFRTGDLGWTDEDGYLHLSGRASTLIVTESGENIQPDDLESRYARHPAIREIGVLQHDGRLAGLVVPAAGMALDSATETQLRAAVNEIGRALPSYQRLDQIALTRKPLPRTRLGKIRRHELAQHYTSALAGADAPRRPAPLDEQEMAAEDRALLEHTPARRAWEWLASRYPRKALTPDSDLHMDLGVDSLEWVGLTLALGQQTGVDLDDQAIGRIETVRDLLQALVNARSTAQDVADPLEEPERALDAAQRRWLEPRGPMLRAVGNSLYAATYVLMRGLFRLQVLDRQHIPAQGPVVLLCNHASHLDPLAVAAAVPAARLQRLYWGGWTGVAFTNPLTRLGSRAAQIIPVDPLHGARRSLALAAAVLQRDSGLIWFPEGERTQTGDVQPFRQGIGLLLARFPVPVVPVAIHGTYEAMPPGRRIPRLRRLSVRFGEPLDPDRLAGEAEGADRATRIVDALQQQLVQLLERGLQ